MSVINKMLRDLDQRQASQTSGSAKPGDAALRRDTASVRNAPVVVQASSRLSKGIFSALVVLVLVLLVGAFWWWQKSYSAGAARVDSRATGQPGTVTTLTFETALSHAAAISSAPAPIAATVPSAVPVLVLADTPTRTSVAASQEATSKPAKVAVKPNLPVERSGKVTNNPATLGKVDVPVAAAATALPVSTAAATGSTTANSTGANAEPQSGSARQLLAGREALAQAQSLWNAGSHDAASELLQQALVLAERTAGSSPTGANALLLATLAREQARMQIANGRPQAALDGLSRLESYIGQDADAWAMRGNAAQRLGRHQDSVRAYTTALQIRPNEQRWLLGAAVSLAALGQAANASEFAAKAHALGPISKEVQSYLRQAGVSLNEP